MVDHTVPNFMMAAFSYSCSWLRRLCLVFRFPFHVLSSREHILHKAIEILLEVLIISFGVDHYLLLILLALLVLLLKPGLLSLELLLVRSILHLEERFLIVFPIQLGALLPDCLEVREDEFIAVKVRDVLQAREEPIRQWAKLPLNVLFVLWGLTLVVPDQLVIEKDVV